MTVFTPSTEQLERLKIASPFAYQALEQHKKEIFTFIGHFGLNESVPKTAFARLIETYTSINKADTVIKACDDTVMAGLRKLRLLLMVRYIWQDTLGLISLERLTYELSVFADKVICFAKDYAYQKMIIRYGEPYYIDGKMPKKDELIIIAMGKLGAMELNLSSDIDLIFVHLGQGQTDGKRCIETQKFMTNLGRAIIKMIDDNTADGFVFRVDMRLRPWGEGSSLVMTLPALVNYFNQHGRTWERFAWLKARIVGEASLDVKEQLSCIRKNFVFRYYVDYSAFSALREMRLLINSQVAQREDKDNIKLGIGGIRDIEFIAQSFALIYGGSYPTLMEKTGCLAALSELAYLQLLDNKTSENLKTAYRFLRRLEHGIQARHDTQTQRLPKDEQIDALACSLGFASAHDLMDALNAHRQAVSVPFEYLVARREYTTNDTLTFCHQNELVRLAEILTPDNQALLEGFWQSKLTCLLSDEAKNRLAHAYPVIVHSLIVHEQQEGLANMALPRLIKLLEAICRRSIYLVMLSENPKAVMDLIPMLSYSPWIADELASYPVLLDTFLQKRYRHLPDKVELMAILAQSLLSVAPFDDEAFLMSIRLFKKTQVLAVAVSDVLHHHPIMKVSDSLTLIAEVVLAACLNRAFNELVYKHGYPVGIDGRRLTDEATGFAVIGYGKLGGIEMSYASDLDVVFLHSVSEQSMTDGKSPISGMKFATRLVQKLINYLATQTRDGRAYELDTRLRPSGSAGVMVVSVSAFLQYQMERAWVWEHQALVRARGICGDKAVLDEFDRMRRQILTLKRDSSILKQEVLAMKEKMKEHVSPHNTDQFHLKKDAGGLIDIEFMAQYCVLNYAYAHQDLAIWSDNVRIFEMAYKLGVWERERCQFLNDAYLAIRKQAHIQALQGKNVLVPKKDWQAMINEITDTWQAVFHLSKSCEK